MPKAPPGFTPLLTYLRDSRGFDFTGYKTASLERRVRKRMDATGAPDFEAYLEYLEVQPDEFTELFNTILINVTGFFRDPEAWDVIREQTVPGILAAKSPDAPIRVWSAACASGEEAYSAAIVLAEALGEDDFRRRVKVYGTDVDEEALDEARQALYDPARLEAVPEDLRERYFERNGNGTRLCFRKDLRRSVIFGRNNLLQDAPISRIDLLMCRNTLMYFTSETQGRILRRLHFALQPTGFLFLGKSEMLLTRRDLFEPVDVKRRIFTRVEPVEEGRRRHMPPMPAITTSGEEPLGLAELVFDSGPSPAFVVARDRTLVSVNEAARQKLRVGLPDIGRPLQDLEVSYRPAELRGPLDAAFSQHAAGVLGPVVHRVGEVDRAFEIRMDPLATDGRVEAVAVTFVDITDRREAEHEADRLRRDLGAAYEELQSTVEELETTNEELQSTNEELETTNEELQSTNEELETMNEELQSTNEELEAMNEALQGRTLELREGNVVMEAVLRARGVGIIVVDREERVRAWSRQSAESWGLRDDEVIGVPLRELDFGMPIDPLRPALRAALLDGGDGVQHVVDARDRRGRDFRCAVTVIPFAHGDDAPAGAILLTESA